MSAKKKKKPGSLSDREIDTIVEAQVADDSAWEKPIQVRKARRAPLSIPPELAARVAFLAQAHREQNVGEWLTRIIKERVELEEIAFVEAKRQMSVRNGI
jgi:hypothetical protein